MTSGQKYLQTVAQGLDDVFNSGQRGKDKQVGFVLLTFPFGMTEGPSCNYVSNVDDRSQIIILMKEMITRLEGQSR